MLFYLIEIDILITLPYYEICFQGKEFEIRLKEKKPGDLSDDLRTALGMPVGQVCIFF